MSTRKVHIWENYAPLPANAEVHERQWVAFCGRHFYDDEHTPLMGSAEGAPATCLHCLRNVRDLHVQQAAYHAAEAEQWSALYSRALNRRARKRPTK